jgi:hypothetical protein
VEAVEEPRCLLRVAVVEAQEARRSPAAEVAEAAVQVRHIALRVVVAELGVAAEEGAMRKCKVEPELGQAEVVVRPVASEAPIGNPQPRGKLLPKALNISMQRWIPF